MNPLHFSWRVLALLLALFGPAQGQAQEPCLKMVLNSFCLGGPVPKERQSATESPVLVEHAQGKVWLDLQDNRVIAITRDIQPANWLNYTDLKVKLVRLYSTAKDTSDFPLYATSRSSKLNAIRAGRGYAAARWQLDGWDIELSWRTLDSMQLRYELQAPADTAPPINTLEGL